MDAEEQHDNNGRHPLTYPPNMMINAPWWSRLIFYWPYPLLKKGLEGPLIDKDIPEIEQTDNSKYNREYLDLLWKKEKERCNQKNNANIIKTQRQHQQQHRTTVQPSLHRAMLIDYFRSIWFVQPLMLAAATAKIVQAVFLGKLIESFETSDDGNGYMYAGVIVICGLVVLFEHHHVFFITWRKGMQLRASCVAAIYQKSLRLSSTHHETNASSGRIMNLASNDVERFLLASLFISHLVWSPLQSCAILVVGWYQIGKAFAVGFILLIFGFVPFQFYLSNRFAFLRSKIAGITDQRVNFVSQAIQGSRVMKMSGYENRFLDRIMGWRRKEVDQISKANRLKALNEALFFSCNIIVSLLIFLLHVFVFGGILTPGNVYTVFTLVNILQLELTKHFSMGVMGVSEVYVSITRIQKFLEFPERPDDDDATSNTSSNSNNSSNDDEAIISISNLDCYWNYVQKSTGSTKSSIINKSAVDSKIGTEPTDIHNDPLDVIVSDHHNAIDHETDNSIASSSLIPALTDINLDLHRGQLTCVIGTVGSGKSALLQAIVGELPAYRGTVTHRYGSHNNHNNGQHVSLDNIVDDDNNNKLQQPGHRQMTRGISYAAQDPWIMDGTVRENITMGLPFNQVWYDEVIDACGLRMDFEILTYGDATIVGDRGVQCSGGQRARIGLARAIYRDSDVLIADDPLSAVDAKVGRQIYHEALLGLAINRGKCVLLATHQHQYIHDHRCVLLFNGHLECIGSYSDCIDAAGGRLSIQEADNAVDAGYLETEESIVENDELMKMTSRIPSSCCNPAVSNINNGESIAKDVSKELVENIKSNVVDKATDNSKESNTSGVVQWDTYCNYIKAMGGFWTAAFILLTFCVTQAIAIWTIITFGEWAELPQQDQGSRKILGLIIGQACLALFLATFRAFFCFDMTLKASKNLHDDMAKAILRAK